MVRPSDPQLSGYMYQPHDDIYDAERVSGGADDKAMTEKIEAGRTAQRASGTCAGWCITGSYASVGILFAMSFQFLLPCYFRGWQL